MKHITMEDIKNLIDFNKKNEEKIEQKEVILEPKPVVQVLGTLVQINGKYYLENEIIDEDGSRFKSSHPVKTIVLGY